ncbi:GNAT family N-acetyltransferase [Nisaea sp.]|uniref:GNAT family N-acetyltransferase n=1 Tax=Nisaea sp. TaxID=2024842 RepID=UPI0032678BAB
MEVELRAAHTGDAEPMTELFITVRHISMPYLPIIHSREETLRWMEHVVLKGNAVTVALCSRNLVGFAAARENFLEHLYVAAEAQGQGIGSKLLHNAMSSQPGPVSLCVFQENKHARRFYERHGFHCSALRDGSQNEEGEPDAIYISRSFQETGSC